MTYIDVRIELTPEEIVRPQRERISWLRESFPDLDRKRSERTRFARMAELLHVWPRTDHVLAELRREILRLADDEFTLDDWVDKIDGKYSRPRLGIVLAGMVEDGLLSRAPVSREYREVWGYTRSAR